jgi:XRE family transcriptional regulator, master regulator for biofilm formation
MLLVRNQLQFRKYTVWTKRDNMIGKNLSHIRKSRGLSLSELSERTGISKSYLSYIERNLNQNPSIQILEKIAFVLKVDLQELLAAQKDTNTILQPDFEWLEFMKDLKESGIEKENLQEYKQLIEFINWKNQQVENKE